MQGKVRDNQQRVIHPQNNRVRAILTEVPSGSKYLVAHFPPSTGQFRREELVQLRELIDRLIEIIDGAAQ